MYKDKDKQREANRRAQAKFKAKGITEGITNQGITDTKDEGITETVDRLTGGLSLEDARKIMMEREGMTSEQLDKATDDLTKRSKPKRGKDIKRFADLSPDVQDTINRLSDNEQEHKRRTAIAIDYQHKHPDRYYPTGAVFTGSMTVMERLFYRPGQRNFVSLPGRACHGVC